MIYGYSRISKSKQSIERQIRNISAEYPDAIIIKEAYTGTTTNRKEWNKLFSAVKAGDTIIFDSVSRMSRNAEEGFEAYQTLYNRGVELIFLKEPHINTTVYRNALTQAIPMTGTNVDFILDGINKYLMTLAQEQIKLAFLQSEKEVEDLHQRTKEGIETARLAGKQIGNVKGTKFETKKAKLAKAQIQKHNKQFGGSLNDKECIELLHIARNTFYKYKKELMAGD